MGELLDLEGLNDKQKLSAVKNKKKEVDLGIANTLYGVTIGGVGMAQAKGKIDTARRTGNIGMPKTERVIRRHKFLRKPAKAVLRNPKTAATVAGVTLASGHFVNAGADAATSKLLFPSRGNLNRQQKALEAKMRTSDTSTGIAKCYDRDEVAKFYESDQEARKRQQGVITGTSGAAGAASLGVLARNMSSGKALPNAIKGKFVPMKGKKPTGAVKMNRAAALAAGIAIPAAIISHKGNSGRKGQAWS